MIPLHQTDAFLAVSLAASNPDIGSVLCRGPSGTGKSELLKEASKILNTVKIPLGADGAALTGSVDLGRLLGEGTMCATEGLLHGDADSFLVAEHFDLFTDEIQDLIMSSGKPVLATISGSEEIRDRLLDRFDLCARFEPLSDPDKRLSVLHAHFMKAPGTGVMRNFVESGRLFRSIRIPGWFLKACSFTCSSLKITGHRGETALCRSAVAFAAAMEAGTAAVEHLEAVAPLVLGHRSSGNSGNVPERTEILKAVGFACEMPRKGEKKIVSDHMQALTDSILEQVHRSILSSKSGETVHGLYLRKKHSGKPGSLTERMRSLFFKEVRMFASLKGGSGTSGSNRSTRMRTDPVSGRPVKPERTHNIREMNPVLSVKASAMDGKRLPLIPLDPEYWRKWRKASKPRVVCMLAVDGSRSSQEYLGDLGLMLDGLFNRVFDRTSRVGLSVIKSGRALVHFSPVRNRLRVFGRLNELEPDGESPLDQLLSLSAAELRRSGKTCAEQKFIILISDCFPEPVPVGDIWNSDIYHRVRKQAANLGRQGIPVMVVDPMQMNAKIAETSPGRRLGRFIAQSTGGKLVSFAKESSYDIFGALKDSAIKPKFISLDDTEYSSYTAARAQVGALFHHMQGL